MRLAPVKPPAVSGESLHRQVLRGAAAARGGHLELDAAHGFVGRYTPPGGQARPIIGKAFGLNLDSATALAGDKDYTAQWLAAAGLPVPSGMVIFSPAHRAERAAKAGASAADLPGLEDALRFAEQQGYPVIVKPNRGREGRGVRVCADPEMLARDVAAGFQKDDQLRVETRVPGQDHRLLVLGARVLLAYQRLPLTVTGDGVRTIADLLDARLTALRATRRVAGLSLSDPQVADRLSERGLTPDATLPDGETLTILDTANLSTGGSLRDLTGQISQAAEQLAVQATQSLGLTLAGVDILAEDLTRGAEGATILEVNAAPSLDHYAAEGDAQFQRALSAVSDMLAWLE